MIAGILIIYGIIVLAVVVLMCLAIRELVNTVRDLLGRVSDESTACVEFVRHLSKVTNDVLNNKR